MADLFCDNFLLGCASIFSNSGMDIYTMEDMQVLWNEMPAGDSCFFQ